MKKTLGSLKYIQYAILEAGINFKAQSDILRTVLALIMPEAAQ